MTCSGKTTLLTHILTTQHGKKIAVILNEFGEYYSWMKRNKIRKTSNRKKHGVIRQPELLYKSYVKILAIWVRFRWFKKRWGHQKQTSHLFDRRKRERRWEKHGGHRGGGDLQWMAWTKVIANWTLSDIWLNNIQNEPSEKLGIIHFWFAEWYVTF